MMHGALKMMHESLKMIEEPYFTIDLQTNSITYGLRFNDVPLCNGSSNIETELPLNLWAFTGRNEIAVVIKDKLVDVSELDIGLYVRDISADYAEAIKIANLNVGVVEGTLVTVDIEEYPGSEKPVVNQLKSGSYVVRQGVNLETPYSEWTWLTSNVIANNDATYKELLAEYTSFHRLLKSRNIEAIEVCMAHPLQDYMASYYISDYQEAVDDFEVSDLAADPDVELVDIGQEEFSLQVFAKGRLARLVDKKRKSPIKFIQSGGTVYIDFMYCRTDSGWLQIR